MVDIVERLRGAPECDHTRCVVQRLQAADEIELLCTQLNRYRENEPKLIEKIERLNAGLGFTDYYEEIVELRAENAMLTERSAAFDYKAVQCLRDEVERLRGALEKIAHPPDDIDAPHYPVSIARAALKAEERYDARKEFESNLP